MSAGLDSIPKRIVWNIKREHTPCVTWRIVLEALPSLVATHDIGVLTGICINVSIITGVALLRGDVTDLAVEFGLGADLLVGCWRRGYHLVELRLMIKLVLEHRPSVAFLVISTFPNYIISVPSFSQVLKLSLVSRR